MRSKVYLCGEDENRVYPKPCPAGGPDHDSAPRGYTEWFIWAEKQAKTRRQLRCEHCGLWGFSEPKPAKPKQGEKK